MEVRETAQFWIFSPRTRRNSLSLLVRQRRARSLQDIDETPADTSAERSQEVVPFPHLQSPVSGSRLQNPSCCLHISKTSSDRCNWKYVDALERERATSKWSLLSGLETLPCTSVHSESTAGSSEFGRAPRSESQQEFVDCLDHAVYAGVPRNA